ncbi:hypothetical protein [Chroococcidiopsis cubana]|nr:hypothetical protein [Chroococcidiopsis cubana]
MTCKKYLGIFSLVKQFQLQAKKYKKKQVLSDSRGQRERSRVAIAA